MSSRFSSKNNPWSENKLAEERGDMNQATLKVAGMTCGQCADSVVGALRNIGAKGHVNLEGQSVVIQYDEQQVSMNNIKEAIEGQGYKVVFRD
jgi:copper chaperone